jgi:ABC-type antimicrobial peptide transport system permease subunit
LGFGKRWVRKTHDILTQFLVEAVTLSIAGGCAGIVLGIAASAIISRLAGWNTVVSMVAVMLAVFFSALVAAYLNPIEALRAE